MPENNIMDDLACNADVENEIRLLIGHGEAEISEIVRKEPKAYQMGSGFIVMPNQSLYPLSAKLSYSFNVSMNKTDDRQLQESTTISICSSHNFFPELEYLYEGIKMHLELSKLNKYESQDFITSAEDLFELSIRKIDYGFTRVRLHPGWSICEIYQQFWLTCGGKHEQIQDLMLYSAAREPATAATSSDVKDRDSYFENNPSIALERMDTSMFPYLQEILLNEITLPFNSTYIVCTAYRANFLCNARCNYRRALNLCYEALGQLNCLSALQYHMFAEFLPFPLKNEWSGLYDENIQILLGFLTLYRSLPTTPTAKRRMIPVYVCSREYLRYIYTKCCRIHKEPIREFNYGGRLPYRYSVNILRYRACFSETILRTALRIGYLNKIRSQKTGL